MFYAVHRGKPFYETLTDYMSSGRIIAMELLHHDAIAAWRELIGPTDCEVARQEAPQSIRARFGKDKTQNACHGSDAPETAATEVDFFFGPGSSSIGRCVLNRDTTLGIIKPHTVADGLAGQVLDAIQSEFDVTALEMFSLTRTDASEFYEVYRGVLTLEEFSGMLTELTSGPFIVVEVANKEDGNSAEPVHSAFRDLCGPRDPELARVLRKDSLRSIFGNSIIKNAVHCTDLEEDAAVEVDFFFRVMQKA